MTDTPPPPEETDGSLLWTFNVFSDPGWDPTWIEWVSADDWGAEDGIVQGRLEEALGWPSVEAPPEPRSITPSYATATEAWITVWAVIRDLLVDGLVDSVVYPEDPASAVLLAGPGGGIDGGPPPEGVEPQLPGGPPTQNPAPPQVPPTA